MNNILINKIKTKLNQPVALVGLMGSGKSSVGRSLATELDWPFADSDSLIVEQAGMSITEIFETKGEAYFRQMEREVIQSLINKEGLQVIGTGGGAFMNEQTREFITTNTLSVFLNGDLQTLVKRVGSGEGRPLFKDKSPEIVLSELIATRYPIYKEAKLTVNTSDESVESTLNRVLQTLYNTLPKA